MAVGFPTKANWAAGDVLTASAQDDLAGTVNLLSNASAATGTTLISNAAGTSFAWQSSYNGNALINGGMDVWQRGTSFPVASTVATSYTADRWQSYRALGVAGATTTRQSSGLTGIQYCMRLQRDSGNTSTASIGLYYSMESSDSYRFAGQAITISFWARKGANYSGGDYSFALEEGTGTDQNALNGFTGATFTYKAATLTTSWVRYSYQFTVNAATTQLGLYTSFVPTGTAGAADYMEITGVQMELGTVATSFKRSNGAGGTLQGELAACQRYYWRATGAGSTNFAIGSAATTTGSGFLLINPVPLRINPTVIDFSALSLYDNVNAGVAVTAVSIASGGATASYVSVTVASGLTVYRPYQLGQNSSSGYIAVSAEL